MAPEILITNIQKIQGGINKWITEHYSIESDTEVEKLASHLTDIRQHIIDSYNSEKDRLDAEIHRGQLEQDAERRRDKRGHAAGP